MSRFAILLGGDFSLHAARRTRRSPARASSPPTAASAMPQRSACVPELWTGDFDSVSDELAAAWPDVPREVFPAGQGQDRRRARRRGSARPRRDLAGAGRRLRRPARRSCRSCIWRWRCGWPRQGLPTLLTSGAQEGRPLLPGATSFDYARGTLFSILGFSELAGLSVDGARWPLDRVAMPFGSSLTISNEVTGDLTIELGSGRALLDRASLSRRIPTSDDGATAPQARRHPPHLRRHAAARRRGALGAARRPHRAGRPQRLRQVDAAEDRRRPDRAAGRRGVPPALGDRPLSAAGARPRRLRHGPRLCRVRSRPVRRSAPRHLSARSSRPDRRGEAGRALRRRGPPRRPCPGDRAAAGHPAARRADQPSRPRHHRMAGGRAQPLVLGADRHLARPPLPGARVARHRLARSRPDAPARQGFCAFRGMARHGAGGGRARAAQARPPDRARGALAALRRHRAAQAQHAPARRIADDAPALPRPSRRRGRGHDGRERRRRIRQAGDRGEGHRRRALAT